MSCSFYAPLARAADSVLLFESAGLRPELCAALRIQLTDVATVECRPELSGVALSERIARAAQVVAQEGRRLGVLLERDPDPRLVRMLLVGGRADQAALAIERIEDRPEPDIDRSLALKVRDAVEVMNVTEERLTERNALAALLVTPKPPAPVTHVELLFEVGGAVSVGQQTRGLGLAGLGLRMGQVRWFEAAVLGQLTSRVERGASDGRVDEREWGLSAGARGGRSFAHGSVGGLLEVGFVRAAAHGIAADGNDGERKLMLPRAAIGLDLRLSVVRGLSLRFAPAVELFPIAQSFAVDNDVKMNLGPVRALLPLTAVVELPLGREDSYAN